MTVMDTLEAPAPASPPPAAPVGPTAGGYAATAAVLALTGALLATWHAGAGADLLIVTLSLGLLFRTPHTVAIWAALTLLAFCALALALQDATLAETLANLVYFGLVIGCLWAFWNIAFERLGWGMPANILHERLVAANVYRRAPTPLVAAAIVALSARFILASPMGVPGDLFVAATVVGALCHIPWRIALWSAGALGVLTVMQAAIRDTNLAAQFADLAIGCLVIALVWWLCGLLVKRFGWTTFVPFQRRRVAERPPSASSLAGHNDRSPSNV